MKISKKIIAVAIVAILSLTLVMSVVATNFPNLPEDPVGLTLAIENRTSWPGVATLSDVPDGYDVANIGYTAFCVEFEALISKDTPYQATLVSSLTLGDTWQKINYLLNNYPLDLDLQIAIWIVLGSNPGADPDYPVTQHITDMVADANANFGSFAMGPGSLVAVKCEIEGAQDLLIILTYGNYEGLTPGFWKNHPLVWEGYSPDDKFNTVFGCSITIDGNSDPTLMEALNAKGGVNEKKGVYDALARHAVAALLNAAHPNVNYPLTEAEIIDAVCEAIENSNLTDAAPLKNTLEMYNNAGGGIDAHGNPI